LSLRLLEVRKAINNFANSTFHITNGFMRVLLSAGEASGEQYGALLTEALRRRVPDLEAYGVGGERMREAGCDLVVDAHEIAVVGLTEVVSSLPRIWQRFHHVLDEVDRSRPDVAVLIDFPDFNLRLAKQLHRRGIPVVYFVSPQLWAWRSGRVAQVRRWVTKMLVIFPFEEQWYRERGVQVEYVGHPLADLWARSGLRESREDFAAQYGLDPLKPWIALLPGSRKKEVAMIGPRLAVAATLLGDTYGFVLPVAPTLKSDDVAGLLSRTFAMPSSSETRALKQTGKRAHAKIVLVRDFRSVLRHARAAVVASGTATVEAALAGVPFVMVYRVSPSSWLLGRRLVEVPHFAMPNLIAGRRVVPELVQRDFTVENVLTELRKLIPDTPERRQMLAGLAEIRDKLSAPPSIGLGATAAERAADAVLRVVASAPSELVAPGR
jgi:lipid-A-disaccharide synthase